MHVLTLFLLLPVVLGANPYWKFQKDALAKVKCPDGGECPNGNTCCETNAGSYGCCPDPNAVCCSDHKHCCPEGYQCDLADNTCTKADIKEKVSLQELVTKAVANVPCPDGGQCSDGDTCCQTSSGAYGCCPQPNAVCCSDGKHCCPEGYQCDLADNTCTKGGIKEKVTLQELVTKAVANVPCPDGGQCPDGNTCCLTTSGSYGCCPQPNAVCCSDGKHCCPEGYQCDLADNTCTKGGIKEKVTLQELVTKAVANVPCPDGGQCPDGNTCCLTTSGSYGCCPQPNAVCCSDHTHCCPEGYQCDVGSGTCVKGTTAEIFSLVKHVKNVKDITCPGSEYTCPDGDTCCPNSQGYGCCPLPDANCCSDGVHCCPSGYTCDLAAGTCLKSSLGGLEDRIPFLKSPARGRL